MTIADVEAFCLPYREPNDAGSTRHICLVKVTTADGLAGWGEAVTLFEEATAATAALVRGVRAILVGQEADAATCRRVLDQHMWWYGGAGIASFAVAAIDTALWDIRGHAEGRSLLELLGGAVHDSLPVLMSSHATRADLRAMAEEMASWVADNQAVGVKVGFGKSGVAHLGFDRDRDVTFLAELRRALGDGPQIMIDIGPRVRWSVAEAVDRTLSFEEHDLAWIEEPLGDDDPAGYAQLKRRTTTKIAYGEREWSVRGVRRIVDTDTVDVVGIDPGRVQGVTGFVAAAAIAHEAGVEANAHAFSGPITYAAALALSLAGPACHQMEIPPHRNELYAIVGMPTRPTAGRVTALTGPGLGLTVDEQAIRTRAVGGPVST